MSSDGKDLLHELSWTSWPRVLLIIPNTVNRSIVPKVPENNCFVRLIQLCHALQFFPMLGRWTASATGVSHSLTSGVPVLKPLDDGRGVDHETAQAEDELDRRGLVMGMAAWCWHVTMVDDYFSKPQFLHIFYSLTLHREYQIGARGGDTRHGIMYRYRLWLKRELQLHSQGISLVNLARWCWTCHGAMWLKLLCLRLYRELNRRMEGVKSWDVVSCRAAKPHQDPTSGYQWLHHENKSTRVFAKWIHK